VISIDRLYTCLSFNRKIDFYFLCVVHFPVPSSDLRRFLVTIFRRPRLELCSVLFGYCRFEFVATRSSARSGFFFHSDSISTSRFLSVVRCFGFSCKPSEVVSVPCCPRQESFFASVVFPALKSACLERFASR
jgi:hypothetical protein